jgi:hypothetical protein
MASGRRVLKFFSGIMRMDAESRVARTEHVAEGSRIDPSQIVRRFAVLAYVYFEDEPGRRSAAKLLSKDEARRIASNIGQAAGADALQLWTQENSHGNSR